MTITHSLGFTQTESLVETCEQQSKLDLVTLGSASDPFVLMMELLGQTPKTKDDEKCSVAPWIASQYDINIPELTPLVVFSMTSKHLLDEVKTGIQKGHKVKPVIIGPVSYLLCSKTDKNMDLLKELNDLLPAYADLLQNLNDLGVEWVQLDEVAFNLVLDADSKHALKQSYHYLKRSPVKILLATYAGELGSNLRLLSELSVDGVHLDCIHAANDVDKVIDWLAHYKIVSLGIVDSSVDTTTSTSDLQKKLKWLKPIHEKLSDRLWLSPSCPFTNVSESHSKELLNEVNLLADALSNKGKQTGLDKVAA